MDSIQPHPRLGDERESRARIAQYLDTGTHVPHHADLVFIPGTRLLDPARIAARLIADGVAPLVVVTGGTNKVTGTCESAALRDELVGRGVALERIVVEDMSTNTVQNVVRAWPLIAARMGGQPVTDVLAVCKWMHSRRVLMTLKANFPAGVRYHACTYAPEGFTRAAWCRGASAPQSGDVMRNWINLPDYLASGDIAEIVRDPGGGWV